MSHRQIVSAELAKLFSALSHPDRIRILEELRGNDRDVRTLSDKLKLSQWRVSQRLATLRSLRLIEDQRDGKQHIYNLVNPGVADWVIDGVKFTELGLLDSRNFDQSVKRPIRLWKH